MLWKLFALLILVKYSLSDYCVRYTFEECFDDLFSSYTNICNGLPSFNISHYEDADLTGYHEHSTKFIYPHSTLTCVSSFDFIMSPNGIVEVIIYMETEVNADLLQVLVMGRIESGDDVFLGQAVSTPAMSTFVPGWHILSIYVVGSRYDMVGYISILGIASSTATILVDSFRYIPPGMDESECEMYESITESTTEITTETTTEISAVTVTDSTTETFPESTTETSTKSTAENTAETTTESATESTAEPTTIPTAVTESEASIDSVHTTELPTTQLISEDSDDSLWTPLRIKILVGLSVLILILSLLCVTCYCCSRSPVSIIVVNSQ